MTALVNHLKSFAHQVKIHNPLANVEGAHQVHPLRKAAMVLPLIGPIVAIQFRTGGQRFAKTESDIRADRRVLHCELAGAVLQTALIVGILAASIILGGPIVGFAIALGFTVAAVAFGAYRSYRLTQELHNLQAPANYPDNNIL